MIEPLQSASLAAPIKIAISSQKGGVAKTTTCLSLAACLAGHDLNILAIDMDAQAHLTQSLGLDPDEVRYTIGDVLLNQVTLLEASRESNVFNLDVVASNRGVVLIEKFLYNSKGYEYRLKDKLDALTKGYYDVVLFDCPPSFGTLTLNALTAADLTIIPITCDYYSAHSLELYIKLLRVVQRNSNPDLEYRLLVTLYDRRTRISQLILDQYQKKYAPIIFETIIPLDSKLRESPLFGRPITQYAANARGAKEYNALARELMQCLKATI